MKEKNPSYELARELRLRYIADDIVAGMSKRKIAEKYSEQWGISKNAIYDYYREALITLTDEDGLAKMREANTERLLNLYNTAMEKGDTKTALKALDLLNRTNSIYSTKIKIDSENEIKFELA